MNRTMVKRGIGAAVLAIMAFLLIAYLLKDKAQQRQDVVNMSLPGVSGAQRSLSIPALKGNEGGESKTGEETKASGETIVASADGTGLNVKTKEVAVNTYKNDGEELDFTIRPPKGEMRQIVDNIGRSETPEAKPATEVFNDNVEHDRTNTVAAAATVGAVGAAVVAGGIIANRASSGTGEISRSSDSTRSSGSVVASADSGRSSQKTYRPRLENERERKANYNATHGIRNYSSGSTVEASTRERKARERRKERAERNKKRKIEQLEAKRKADKVKAREKAKVTPVPVPVDAGRHYSIQLLATSSASRATKLKKVMKQEGYDAFISKLTKEGKVLYRVKIGNFRSRNSAEKAQEQMKQRYQKNVDVQASFIVKK
ncbi:MAG: SPOR domain-containing protein [Cocleimonas sp.]|nr:SPOR domain-containing protein [Cocleimonas sp.]